MTVSVILGLLLQGAALVIMRRAVGGQWIRHVGAQLLIVATIYHGLTEVIQAIFPGRNWYRDYVTQAQIDDWVLLVSVALLVYAIAYATVVRRPDGPPPPVSVEGISLKWMLLLALPIVALALQGYAFAVGNGDPTEAAANGYFLTGLIMQFMLLIIPVTAALAIIKFGPRWAVLILAVQAGVMAATGARSAIIFSCVIAMYGAALAGVRVPRRQLVAAGLVVALLAMTISVTRSIEGRETFSNSASPTGRLEGLGKGLAALPSARGVDAVLDDFVYRLDGNNFGAAVLFSLEHGKQPVGTATLRNSAILAVPSFLYPDKLQSTVQDRSEKKYFVAHFGTLSNRLDLLPTVWGSMLGYYGPVGLIVLSVLLAIGMALVDRKVTKGSSPAYFILGIGLAQFVLSYEKGPQEFFLQFRGVLLLMLVVWAAGAWQRAKTKPRPDPPMPPEILRARAARLGS